MKCTCDDFFPFDHYFWDTFVFLDRNRLKPVGSAKWAHPPTTVNAGMRNTAVTLTPQMCCATVGIYSSAPSHGSFIGITIQCQKVVIMRCMPFKSTVFLVDRAWVNLITILAWMCVIRSTVQMHCFWPGLELPVITEKKDTATKACKEYLIDSFWNFRHGFTTIVDALSNNVM